MWNKVGIPHKGWEWEDVEDLGEPSHTCEMCDRTDIRYVHHLRHDETGETIKVGCVCAEKMTEDYVGPKKAERKLVAKAKSRDQRRARWLDRNWRVSAKGNDFLRAQGNHVVVYPFGTRWTYVVNGKRAEESYATKDAAKLAAFDTLNPRKP